MNLNNPLIILSVSILVLLFIFIISTFSSGQRNMDSLKNIHGIFFYPMNEIVHVTEELAHTSLNLKEPVLAKELRLTVSFNPRNTDIIAVGVRKNPFWLSYDWQEFYSASDGNGNEIITETITIPLSDALQHPDRSVDLMFRTQADTEEDVWWELHAVDANVSWTRPSRDELKEYIKKFIRKERPL